MYPMYTSVIMGNQSHAGRPLTLVLGSWRTSGDPEGRLGPLGARDTGLQGWRAVLEEDRGSSYNSNQLLPA